MGKVIISANVSLDGLGGGTRFLERVGQIRGEAARSCSTRASAPRPSCLAGARTSSSPPAGRRAGGWRTG